MTELVANADRLWSSLMRMAEIGGLPNGGVCRLAGSREDGQARDLFAAWCRAEGMTLRVDRIGNMFARREGLNRFAAPVLIGSHLDTQPVGGRFDGTFGVLAGLELVRVLNENSISTNAPIEVVNWTNEEGARFQPSSLGAQVFAGTLDLSDALARQDTNALSVGECLAAIGYLGDSDVETRSVRAYLEGHIEQGPFLEELGVPIGIVVGAVGINAFEITLTGVEAHTGTTPISSRSDALLAAARIITAVHELASRSEPQGRASVAQVSVEPNARSVVASRVKLTADCRHRDPAGLKRMTEALVGIVHQEASAAKVGHALSLYWAVAPVTFDRTCVDALAHAAATSGYRTMDMVSGAGHDAMAIAGVVPTAMLFVPSAGGISHNQSEYTSPEELAAGCAVLMNAAVELANT